MGGHSVKLTAFLINLKVPRVWRDRVPLLVAGDEIAWVCGRRVGERFAVGADARRVARLQFERMFCERRNDHAA
jgi:tRNA(Ile)-lysidine synthase